MKSSYMLGFSLTDPSDLSKFLVLVSSYNSNEGAMPPSMSCTEMVVSWMIVGTNQWLDHGKPAWV
jgi:hypothetical protein